MPGQTSRKGGSAPKPAKPAKPVKKEKDK